VNESALQQLVSMGFDPDESRSVLESSGNDLAVATNVLLQEAQEDAESESHEDPRVTLEYSLDDSEDVEDEDYGHNHDEDDENDLDSDI